MNRFLTVATLGAVMIAGGLAVGCSHEVSHSEKDKPNLFGGQTHEESTTYKNADGSYTTEKSQQKTQ